MQRYIVRRLLTSIPVFIGITVIMFLLINSAPGDPLVALVSPDAMQDPELRERLRPYYQAGQRAGYPDPGRGRRGSTTRGDE